MPPKTSKFRKPRNPNQAGRSFRPRTTGLFSKNVQAHTRNTDTVLTPKGPFPKSKVHFVPEGARVHRSRDAIQIIGRDGKIIHSNPILRSTDPRFSSKTASVKPDIQDGWYGWYGWDAFSYWQNDISENWEITNFSTAWIVPDEPSNYDDQTIFLFNALEPDSEDTILQPALQYGHSAAGGGKYWSIASWYLVNYEVYHTTLISVSSGALLVGIMAMTDIDDDDTYYWNSIFSGYPKSSLNISTDDELTNAYEALETYNCTSASDLPSGSTAMQSIFLQTGFECPSLTWSTVNDFVDDTSVTVVVDGSINGEVDINY